MACLENEDIDCGGVFDDNGRDDGGEDSLVFIMIGEGSGTPGSMVEVPLFYESSTSIAGIQFTISDYPDWLTSVDVISNTCFESSFNEIDGSVIGILFSLNGCELDPQGTITQFATLVYEISANSNFGSDIELVFEEIIVAGSEGQALAVNAQGGVVSLNLPGDVTADGEINVLDVVTLINFILYID